MMGGPDDVALHFSDELSRVPSKYIYFNLNLSYICICFIVLSTIIIEIFNLIKIRAFL